MSGKPSKILATLDEALDGDQAAIDILSLQPAEVTYRHTRPLTLADLKNDYKNMARMYKAASLLEVGCLETVAGRALRYISFLAKEKYDHDFTIEETTVQVLPLMKAMKRVAGDVQSNALTVDDSPSEEKEKEKEETPKEKKKKKFQLSIRKRTRENSSSSSSSSSSSDGEGEEPPKKKKKQERRKRKHHAQVKCPFKKCGFNGSDIKRHITLVQVKLNKEVEEEDVPRLSAIFKAGKSLRGPRTTSGKKLGKIKKWCPVPGCCFITPFIHHHLKAKHKAKVGTVEYRVHLKNARNYKGLTAEVNLIVNNSFNPQTHDPEPQPSTSRKEEWDSETEPEISDEIEAPQAALSEGSSQSDSSASEDADYNPKGEGGRSAEYYNATSNFDSPRHQRLCGYFGHLRLPDAGYKAEKTRLQHVRQVAKLLEDLDPNGADITVLSKDDGDIVWSNWVDPHLEKGTKAPGTIVSYLTSLEKFYIFLTSRKYDPKKMPPLHPNHMATFQSMKTSLKGWRATVDLRTQDRQVRRYLNECDDMLTSAEMEKLKTSKPYNNGLKALSNADAGKLLSVQEFLEARDLLLVKLTIATGTRPAPLENAILEDYSRAKVYDGKKIMLVARHKRSADGPAILGFDSELQKLMEIYLEHIRPNFAQDDVKNIFVKRDGKEFTPGTIGKRLSAFWEKSGVSLKRVATTAVRKFISTSTHLHAPEEADKVAKVMSHSKETAKRSYVRADLTKVGSQAMEVIKNVTLTKSPADETHPTSSSSSSSDSEEEVDSDIIPPTVNQNVPAGNDSGAVKSGLTPQQKDAVKEVYQRYIASGENVPLKVVRSMMSTNFVLRKLACHAERVKQVVNCISYLQSTHPRQNPQEMLLDPIKPATWLHTLHDDSSSVGYGNH